MLKFLTCFDNLFSLATDLIMALATQLSLYNKGLSWVRMGLKS